MCDDLPLKVSGSSVRFQSSSSQDQVAIWRALRQCRLGAIVGRRVRLPLDSNADSIRSVRMDELIVQKGRSVSPEFQGLLEMNGSLDDPCYCHHSRQSGVCLPALIPDLPQYRRFLPAPRDFLLSGTSLTCLLRRNGSPSLDGAKNMVVITGSLFNYSHTHVFFSFSKATLCQFRSLGRRTVVVNCPDGYRYTGQERRHLL